MNISVTKRDGSEEEFNKQKIARVAKAAGLENNEAKLLADRVEKSVLELRKDKVTSIEIRDIVVSELEKTDGYAAGLFKWYQHVKDKEKHG